MPLDATSAAMRPMGEGSRQGAKAAKTRAKKANRQEPGDRADHFAAIAVDAAIPALDRIHIAQLLSYLKTTGLRLGLLLNFGQPRMNSGIRRLVHTP